MATLYYTISGGTPSFTVNIEPSAQADNIHNATGTYYFTNLDDDTYTITVTDDNDCEDSFIKVVNCNGTTTTTSTTSTTTTTITTITRRLKWYNGTWNTYPLKKYVTDTWIEYELKETY